MQVIPRRVEPELLDSLPAGDPRAIHARRDLRRVNAWMFQPQIMARALRMNCPPGGPRTIVELGAGDGTFMLRVARRVAADWGPVTLTLIDMQNLVTDETRHDLAVLGWRVETITADVFDALEGIAAHSVGAITANLFLHHFLHDRLKDLLRRAADATGFFAACEPRRGRPGLVGASLLWAIGCNDVTRIDAALSVHAGFAGRELSGAWPDAARWQTSERAIGPFTHLFTARRASDAGA